MNSQIKASIKNTIEGNRVGRWALNRHRALRSLRRSIEEERFARKVCSQEMEDFVSSLSLGPRVRRVKIDIGLGFRNIHSEKWLRHEKDLLVVAFDPNYDSVVHSRNNVKQNVLGDAKMDDARLNECFYVIPVALGNVQDKTLMDFYRMTKDCGTSSLLRPIAGNLGPVKKVSHVPVFSLRHFFDLFPWDRIGHIDYVKIDAQGVDLDIIKGAGDYLRERVVYLMTEAESTDYENCAQNTEDNITAYLLTQNFRRINPGMAGDPVFINEHLAHLKDQVWIG